MKKLILLFMFILLVTPAIFAAETNTDPPLLGNDSENNVSTEINQVQPQLVTDLFDPLLVKNTVSLKEQKSLQTEHANYQARKVEIAEIGVTGSEGLNMPEETVSFTNTGTIKTYDSIVTYYQGDYKNPGWLKNTAKKIV